MNKKQIIIIVTSIVLVAIVVWYFFRKPKAQAEVPPTTPPQNLLGSIIADNDNFPLQMGSTGSNVKLLQAAINQSDERANLKVDGVFGDITKDSVQTYFGYQYYPVTKDKFDYILELANLN